jgi:hypothetical protein
MTTGASITANWDAGDGEKWAIPVGLGISRTTIFAKRPISLSIFYYHNFDIHPELQPISCESMSDCFTGVDIIVEQKRRTQ